MVNQVYHGLRQAIQTRQIPLGERLPSSRAAARHLAVSRNTINAAYDLLAAEGVITLRRGAAPEITFASGHTSETSQQTRNLPKLSQRGADMATLFRRPAKPAPGALTPGNPDLSVFPAMDWARCLRRAAQRMDNAALGYADYHGTAELRRVLADQLLRHRAIAADPDQILITPGTQASLSLLALALTDPGETALLESPGFIGARSAFHLAGLQTIPLPVDAMGADVTRAPTDGRVKLIYVTPSNQFPAGARMALSRRTALLDYVQRHGAIVVEDDYDSEFLWHARQIEALYSTAAEGQVIYLGSASKSLFPGMRLGWIVVPAGLEEALHAAHRNLGLGANVQSQIALAEFIASGQYRAHIRRISRLYATREAMLTNALSQHLGGKIGLSRPAGGLQVMVELRATQDETAILESLCAAGFSVSGLSGYCVTPEIRKGLVIGFGDANERNVNNFVTVLAKALAEDQSNDHVI